MKISKFLKTSIFITLFSLVAFAGFGIAHAQVAGLTLEAGFNPMAPSGTAVYLRGTGIDANSRILISSPLSASSSSTVTPSAYTNTSITFNIPQSQGLGDRTVQIQQADTGALSNGVTLSICNPTGGCPMPPPPVISAVAPYPSTVVAMGVAVPATLIIPRKTISINGTNFQSSVGGNAYYIFDDGLSIPASIGSDASGATILIATVPSTINIGQHTVRARLANGFLSNAFTFNVVADPTPVITSISPTSAHIGDIVTITGSNFAANSKISLENGYSSNAVLSFTLQSNTSITFKYPSTICSVSGNMATLNMDVYVSSVGTDGVYRYGKSPMKLTALDDCRSGAGSASTGSAIPTPILTSLSTSIAAAGDTITVNGDNFASNAYACFINPADAMSPTCLPGNGITPITPATSTSLKFVVPNYVGAYATYVAVVNDGTPPKVSNALSLSIVAVNPGAPTITSLVSHGTSDGFMFDNQGKKYISAKIGDKIDVNGSKFNSNSKVLIDGKVAPTFVSSDTLLTFTIPSDTWVGINNIQISQTDTGFVSNTAKLSTVPPIVLTSVDPAIAKPGDTITVTGKNFVKEYWAILDPDKSTRSMAGIPAGCDMKRLSCSLISTDGGNTLTFVLAQSLGSGVALPAGTHTIRLEQIDRGYNSNTISFTVAVAGTVSAPTSVPTPPSIPTCTSGQILVSNQCVDVSGANQTSSQSGSSTGGKYNFGDVTLYRGSRGEAVKELQRFFNTNLNLNLIVDGKIGPKTVAIIKQWQKDHGLTVDGRVGPKSKAAMNAEAK